MGAFVHRVPATRNSILLFPLRCPPAQPEPSFTSLASPPGPDLEAAPQPGQFSFETDAEPENDPTMKSLPSESFVGANPASVVSAIARGAVREPRAGFAVFFVLALVAVSGPARAAGPVLAGEAISAAGGDLIVHPINHATLALQWKGLTIYVDPVGGVGRFADLPRPDLILLTDIHGDHLDAATLKAIVSDQTKLVAPPAAAEQLPADLRPRITVLANGQTNALLGVAIEAVPAYNLAADRQKFHARGRGNGYVLTLGGKRVYLSGDTEDIPEMRALKQIDVAFVCMNLPYTMTVDQAASAVREFKPKIVYPYHCRGSDLEKFQKLVGDDPGIDVRLRDWYKP